MKEIKELINFFIIHPIIQTIVVAILVIIVFRILWFVLLKQRFEETINAVKAFPEQVKQIDKITELETKINQINNDTQIIKESFKGMLYSRLIDKLEEAKNYGGKTHHQDENFQAEWKNYKALGDGNGDGVIEDWNKIAFITNNDYYNKKINEDAGE